MGTAGTVRHQVGAIFIFGFGGIPAMGVRGAAIATVMAQMIVCLLFLMAIRKDTLIFLQVHILSHIHLSLIHI